MPKSVTLPVNLPTRAIHLLSGVSGWGFPLGEKGSVSMIVRFHYQDGKVEDHPLKNGVVMLVSVSGKYCPSEMNSVPLLAAPKRMVALSVVLKPFETMLTGTPLMKNPLPLT